MTADKSDGAAAPVPPRRADAQRERILASATHCFIEHGFHGAGMARIAQGAGMSPGLIYRYFENKAAIIRAIVERQLVLLREDVRLHRRIDLAEELLSNFGRYRADDPRRLSPALLLELSAEATRDAEIRAIVHDFDQRLREALTDWLVQGMSADSPGMPADEARARALMLQLVFEGLKLREAREPHLDRELLARTLKHFLPGLLGNGCG